MPAQACTPTAAAPSAHQGLAFGTPDGMGLGAYSYQSLEEQWKLIENYGNASYKRSKYDIMKEGGAMKFSVTEFLNRAEPSVNAT
eukprot:1160467-Pelagomonas_calceolata.AAC.2